MATKADFTPDEWQVLEWAVTDTMAYVSMADPGLWDAFKEAKGAAKYMAEVKTTGESAFIRELAGEMKAKRDKDVSRNPADVAGEVLERVGEAVQIVSRKAPDDLEAFRALITGVAKATAEAAHGTGANEAAAIAKLEAALG